MTEHIEPARNAFDYSDGSMAQEIVSLREEIAVLQEAHDHAQTGLRNARKQETEMREKIAALEAEVIKSAERIEEYRAELRERDDRLCGVGVEMQALRALNAARTFNGYAILHSLKGPQDGDRKAAENRAAADLIRVVIAKAEKGTK